MNLSKSQDTFNNPILQSVLGDSSTRKKLIPLKPVFNKNVKPINTIGRRINLNRFEPT